VVTKESENDSCQPKGLLWGSSCMQGWRVRMEDAHFAIGSLDGPGWEDTAAFGVMDGHGGKEVAEFCAHYLPVTIAKGSIRDVSTTLTDAFHGIDDMLRNRDSGLDGVPGYNTFGGKKSAANPQWVGCTAVVCLVRSDVIIVANAGDSRAVLSRRRQAVPLSEDHKPNDPRERGRIEKAGGYVERQQVGPNVQYRVNGNLNLSRSIGDLEYKKNSMLEPCEQMICSTPDVQSFRRETEDEFMIVACDGVWDVLSNQDAVDFVHARLPACLRDRQPLSGILEEMLDNCISPDLMMTQGLGGDNMTALLVVFNSGTVLAASASPVSSSPQARHLRLGRSPGMSPSTDGMESPSFEANVDEGVIVPRGLCWCQSGNATK